jgi:catechol 2,3-dioxygenase-like lactoylglutathione lyase family enzyme
LPGITAKCKDDAVIDHLAIQCADVDASGEFYDAILRPLGGARIVDNGDVTGYGWASRPSFWLGPRNTGEGFRESHIAFEADTRDAVRAFFDAAVGTGAAVLYAPKVWPEYHPDYYAAFVRDPDGNNIEAVCHIPEN